MPSPKLARLQDETVSIENEINDLRSVTPADEGDKKRIEDRLAALYCRAGDIATEAKCEVALD